jgi:uncharacterized membrane protein YsdA (DUF1294 family)
MNQILSALIIGYLAIMSLIGFVIMGIDKQKARRKAWRVSERVLFGIAFAGGGLGSFLGMYAFHHKTKHTKFVVLLPLAAVLYGYVLYQISKSI